MGNTKLRIRTGTARYPRGQQRIEAILRAAEKILIKQGYGKLTMRNVARAAKTTVGNIQYYYPTKERILRDLLDYTLRGIFEDFEAIAGDAGKTPEQKLLAFLTCIIDSFRTEKKTKFYPEFWVQANRDPVAAKVLEEMYERGLLDLQNYIMGTNTSLNESESRDMALTVMGSVEGMVIFIGRGRPWEGSFEAVRDLLLTHCVALVKNARGSRPDGHNCAAV